MAYAFMVAYIPHQDHGFWLWSVHDASMDCVMSQQPGSTGFETPDAALSAAIIAWNGRHG